MFVKYNGTGGNLKTILTVTWSLEVKERRDTGKNLQSPAVAWNSQAWKHWPLPSGVYYTRWEVSHRRLLTCGANRNCCGTICYGVLDVLALVATAVKATVEYVVGQREVSAKMATLERNMRSVSEDCPPTLSCLWTKEWPDAVYAPAWRCLVPGKAMAPTDHISV